MPCYSPTIKIQSALDSRCPEKWSLTRGHLDQSMHLNLQFLTLRKSSLTLSRGKQKFGSF